MSGIKENFIYNTSYQILKMFIPLITTPYISRVLGPNGTGVYSYAYAIAAYFVMFAMLGVNNYGNRSIAMIRDHKEELNRKFTSIYLFQLGTSAIMIVLYIVYVLFICENKYMGFILLAYVVSAGLDINWLFAGLEKFKIIVLRNMCIQLLTAALIFLLVRKSTDVYIYAIINVIGIVCSHFIMWSYMRRYVHFVKVSRLEILEHMKPNFILFIPLVAVSLYKVMDKVMLGMLCKKAEVGYYEACEKICAIPSALITSLGSVMLPRMSNLFAKNDERKSARYIEMSILYALFSSTAVAFGIMSISKEFVPFYYGQGYEKCILLYQWLLPSSIFVAFANVIRVQYLIPRKYDKIFILSVSLGAIVNICLNLLLIQRLQSIGAAIGTFAAELAVCMYQCFAVRKELPIRKFFLQAVPFIGSGLIMYCVLSRWQLSFSNVIFSIGVKVIVGVILYMGVLCGSIFIFRKNLFREGFFIKK